MDRARWHNNSWSKKLKLWQNPGVLKYCFQRSQDARDHTKICVLDHLDVNLQSSILELSNC